VSRSTGRRKSSAGQAVRKGGKPRSRSASAATASLVSGSPALIGYLVCFAAPLKVSAEQRNDIEKSQEIWIVQALSEMFPKTSL
jgi:hypothetical protein